MLECPPSHTTASIGIITLTTSSTNQATLLVDLQTRGLINQMSSGHEFIEHLKQPRTLYCGFDPTADSLHIGSLVPIIALMRFQQAGHTPIALVGGATGLVGDPSFKAQERKLNTEDRVNQWVLSLKQQLSQFLDFDSSRSNAAIMVNNYEWTQNLNVLDYLRIYGKHFSVNSMIQKESVKQRIDRKDSGISYTEFSYILLQSLDFAQLYKLHNCTLQIGGSDQWGNITAGTDLVKRTHDGKAFGLTLPLVTKSDGSKFGKTEAETIWLSATKTSPYSFYQFWLNTNDADIYRFLRYFTFISTDEINAIEEVDKNNQTKPEGTGILAEQITHLVHGAQGLQAAQRITEHLFSGDVRQLTHQDLKQLQQDGLPCSPINQLSASLIQLLSEAGLGNGKQIKDSLNNAAIRINNIVIGSQFNTEFTELFSPEKALYRQYFIVRMGKKKYHLFTLTS